MTGLAVIMAVGAVLLVAGGIWRLRHGNRVARVSGQQLRAQMSAGERIRRVQRIGNVGMAVIGGGLALVAVITLGGPPFVAISAAALTLLVPSWLQEVQRHRRFVLISEQLDQAMGLITSSLRRGIPLETAFLDAGNSLGNPLGEIIRQVGGGLGLGMGFTKALNLTREHPTVATHPDWGVFVTQLTISAEKGANIVESFAITREVLADRRRDRIKAGELLGEHVSHSVAMFGMGVFFLILLGSSMEYGLSPLMNSAIGQLTLVISYGICIVLIRTLHLTMLRQQQKV